MVERDLNAAWAAIGTATVDDHLRRKGWDDWARYAGACNVDPWLRYHSHASKQTHLIAFAARVRTGIFGRAIQVGHQSVEKALRYVAQTLVLAGYPDPRRTGGATALDLPFSRLLASYKTQDPAPRPQLALPVMTVARAAGYHTARNAITSTTADLVTIAFFYLLRVGEYTMPQPHSRTRTVQSRVQDVTFRRYDGTVIPNSAPVAQLLQAASSTLWMDNQKNGQRGATILHTAVTSWFCPVKALARRVSKVIGAGGRPETPLSYVRPGVHIFPKDITTLVKFAAAETNFVEKGYALDRIGTHSLRASGAMSLKLQGVEDSTIMKIGRWTGLTFLTYIHAQIGALNAGIAQRMAIQVDFVNIGG